MAPSFRESIEPLTSPLYHSFLLFCAVVVLKLFYPLLWYTEHDVTGKKKEKNHGCDMFLRWRSLKRPKYIQAATCRGEFLDSVMQLINSKKKV